MTPRDKFTKPLVSFERPGSSTRHIELLPDSCDPNFGHIVWRSDETGVNRLPNDLLLLRV